MSNSATVSRAQLVYGLCLPLAALIGFFIAGPMRLGTMAILGMMATCLVWPLFARWHHPLLVGSLHSVFLLGFLPGYLPLWTVVALGGGLIVIFRRCLDPEVQLFPPGGVAWALLALGVVIAATAFTRGGVGLKSLGSETMGGKKYFFALAAIMSYFVLVSRPVPRKQALWYVGLFCLSGLTYLLSHLVYSAGSKFYWLFNIVDSAPALGQARVDWDVGGSLVFRSTAGMGAAGALISFLLARIGLRETLNLRKPWRLLLLLGCIALGSLGGFRSFWVGTALMLAGFFYLEGLHRTRYLAGAIALGLVAFAALANFSDELPLTVQRFISFLPVRIDPVAMQDAQGSLDWRLEMWKLLWQDMPQYAFWGKGYAIDPAAFQMSGFNEALGFGARSEWAILTGEYHNGPFSVAIPFGIWGVLAFGWFLVAGALRLRWFCRHGHPELLNLNRALCVWFTTKIIFFTFFFGALNSDLVEFAVLAGLAECLNAAPKETGNEAEETSEPVAFEEGMV